MALDKQDLQDIKEVLGDVIEERVGGIVEEKVGGIIEQKVPGIVDRAVEPYFNAIQKDFNIVYKRFDKLESLIQDDYKRRLEKLEDQIKEMYEALAIKPKLA
ncbi:MAG TPA: hypothetical protein VGA53_02920 [Candidatus Paceibacterota bacterium]